MTRIRRTLVGAVVSTLVLTSLVPSALAKSTATVPVPTENCAPRVGAVGPEGHQSGGPVEPVFEPGKVRLATTFTLSWYNGYADMEGWVVQGDSAYYRTYAIDTEAHLNPDWPNDLVRVGGGWTNFKDLEIERYGVRTTAYGLRSDGVLFRWNVVNRWAWKATGSAPGFASVKSMAMISKTATYETFLANTRGGALYTIHIPVSAPMKPIVKPVRTRTWQGFEKLIAGRCGNYGTLLIGIDKDTQTAYRYAVGHANGTATVIKGLGKIDGTFPDQPYFRLVDGPNPLNGE
jgi:hypothetical protein